MEKIVLISGGTCGIGLATAEKFLDEGDTVVVLGRTPRPEALASLRKCGPADYLPCDVSSREDCARVVETVLQQYGRIDVLVNVAGVVGKRAPFMEIDLDDVENTIAINLLGTIYLSHYAARSMAARRSGVIINVGSICGFMANTESIGYHASKGGVKMLTAAMAREISPFGVRVASVAPGWVRTGMIDPAVEQIGASLHMKGRIIEPAEIAGAIWLLTLPEASAINGSTVMADDGYTQFKGVDGYQA